MQPQLKSGGIDIGDFNKIALRGTEGQRGVFQQRLTGRDLHSWLVIHGQDFKIGECGYGCLSTCPNLVFDEITS